MRIQLTMWLGLAFVVLAIVAVALQAWLWGFPYDKATRTSAAPRSWTFVHRIVGYVYTIVYIVMMVEMVPRLWRYQVELPARSVIHACLGITIGILLLTKLSILRFFRHFEEAMPKLGLALLVCTLLMAALSLPYALRAHAYPDEAYSIENRTRTRAALAALDFGVTVDLDTLASAEGLGRGQGVVVSKCAACHDLRTVLIKPRTPAGWLDLVERMADKPTFGEAIDDTDIALATAYLVAITPELQQSVRRRKQGERQHAQDAAAFAASAPTPVAPPDLAKLRPLFEKECAQCHKLSEVDKHGLDDEMGWRKVVTRMIEENDAELVPETANDIVRYLAATKAKH